MAHRPAGHAARPDPTSGRSVDRPAGHRVALLRSAALLVAAAATLVLPGPGAAAAPTSTSTPATPAQAAGCQPSQVAVVVDFGELGGGVQTGCADERGSGLAALADAGFGYSFVPNQPGLVCQIDTLPNPCRISDELFWGYFHADAGGSWAFSDLGAGNRSPAAGSVEGWSYGGGRSDPPSVAPPRHAAAPVPSPTPTAPPPPGPAPTAPAGPGATTPPPPPRPDATTTTAAPGPSTATTAPPAPAIGDDEATDSTTAPDGDAPTDDGAAGDDGATGGDDGTAARGAPDAGRVVVDDEEGGGFPTGLALGTGAVGLLAVLTARRALVERRRDPALDEVGADGPDPGSAPEGTGRP